MHWDLSPRQKGIKCPKDYKSDGCDVLIHSIPVGVNSPSTTWTGI